MEFMMRQFFSAFLALLMLMPSLACAMPVCVQSQQTSASIEKPCHDHQQKEQKSDHVRFVIDCMGVDLQKTDTTTFEKADIQHILIDLPFINNTASSQNLPYSPQIIRGPPPEWQLAQQSKPSTILITQRLRI